MTVALVSMTFCHPGLSSSHSQQQQIHHYFIAYCFY